MNVEMSCATEARCPSDGLRITYDVMLALVYRQAYPESILLAEQLTAVVDTIARVGAVYQEQLTAEIWAALLKLFETDGIEVDAFKVVTKGTHQGVVIRCEV